MKQCRKGDAPQKKEVSLGSGMRANLPKGGTVAVSGFKMFLWSFDKHFCLGFLCPLASTPQLVTLVTTRSSALVSSF